MSAALEARGLTLDQARADLARIRDAHGTFSRAGDVVGIPASSLYSAYSGQWGPGARLLEALYGPSGCVLRPELLVGGATFTLKPPSSPAVSAVAAPVCGPDAFGGMSVAELLRRAQVRAVELENELGEALGEIASLKAMAARLAGGLEP